MEPDSSTDLSHDHTPAPSKQGPAPPQHATKAPSQAQDPARANTDPNQEQLHGFYKESQDRIR